MMYTSLKFESGEAARSQVEPLQIQTRLILGHENCSNGGQKYMCRGFSMNRRYDKYGRYCCNRPENGSKQSMQKPIKCIASDPQCLQLVTGTCASVASCLNTIGRKIVAKCFQQTGFLETPVTGCKVCAAANSFAKLVHSTSWTTC